ncbi:GxxExxY protein [Belliella aquatica]|uniref:GxxExxY protein n=1 Tax=Belliella aquatica TaxID=1323734 RepID=A0ABQ1M9V5_9BACT|nr:GxxExxY protein [Belliella aquatica]MCH7405671.1 GxxExxY protein [Belliella aquatica]GGC36876.1 hypothetical protein GCM10010993_14630 [Belliella aquatica]
MVEDLLTRKVIGAAIEIHKELGPGLLESAYQRCLEYELLASGLEVKKELIFPIRYKEVVLNHAYRIDLLVENQLVIELKTVEFLTDVHLAQILTYMKFGGYKKGILLNFDVKVLKDGIKRVVL